MNFDNETNILVLAYLGDSVYELFIRKYLIDKDISKIDDLQKEAIKYVSAYGQVSFLNYLIQAKILNDNELDIEEQVDKLIMKANTRGGNDNITIAYARMSGE